MATITNQQHHDQDDHGRTPEMFSVYENDRINDTGRIQDHLYPDPAILNPEELATFPKQVTIDNHHHHHHESHLVNSKRTPVRDGRNITRTDNNPDRHGFM